MFEKIKIIFMDVDGVLTPGQVYTGKSESPRIMHVRDRLAVKALKKRSSEDIKVYWITARDSQYLADTGRELDVDGVYAGIGNKKAVLKKLLDENGLGPGDAAYIGDDLVDLACMNYVSVSCTPSDAPAELKQAADYVSSRPGGRGAVRDIIEKILKERNKWREVVESYEKDL